MLLLPQWSESVPSGCPAEGDLLALDLRGTDVRSGRRLRGLAAVGGVDQSAGRLSPPLRRPGRNVEHVELLGLQIGDAVRAVRRGELFA